MHRYPFRCRRSVSVSTISTTRASRPWPYWRIRSCSQVLLLDHRPERAGRDPIGGARLGGGADVFGTPGTAELQSLATLEAMSAGKPVIAADAMALPHLITEGHNGYLYTPGHTRELTDHIARLLSQPAQRRRMGLASRTMADQHAISHTLDTFETRYAKVRSARSTRRRPPATVSQVAAATPDELINSAA